MMTAASRQVDVVKFVDSSAIAKEIIIVAALCAGVSFLDGFDILAISYVAPVLSAAWKLPKEAFGPIFAATYIGAAAGAVFFGWYADRYGRRLGVIIPTAIFGLFALLTAYAFDFRSLAILRMLTGIGLGGALSNAVAMVSEHSPQRARATLISVMYTAFPLGGVVGGPISAALIARYGWEAVFILGGVLPLLLTVVLLVWLDESIRFLVLSKVPAAQIGDVLQRIASFKPLPSDIYTLPQSRGLSTKPAREIFSREFVRTTVLLCVAAFVAQVILVYIVTWMPLVLSSLGIDATRAILVSVAFTAGGIFGTIGLARIIDKDKSYRALVISFFLSALAVATIGFFASNWYALLAITFLSGAPTIGANILLYAFSATVYPAPLRSTGVGWVVGCGRVGAIAGALLGTLLSVLGLGIASVYGIAAIPAIIGGIAIALTKSKEPPD
jgi:MFS transporter, AAHS family, 4-hydroxybenzoate transporter